VVGIFGDPPKRHTGQMDNFLDSLTPLLQWIYVLYGKQRILVGILFPNKLRGFKKHEIFMALKVGEFVASFKKNPFHVN
jgi:hypothetical protein